MRRRHHLPQVLLDVVLPDDRRRRSVTGDLISGAASRGIVCRNLNGRV
jgi:hypothetical protein